MRCFARNRATNTASPTPPCHPVPGAGGARVRAQVDCRARQRRRGGQAAHPLRRLRCGGSPGRARVGAGMHTSRRFQPGLEPAPCTCALCGACGAAVARWAQVASAALSLLWCSERRQLRDLGQPGGRRRLPGGSVRVRVCMACWWDAQGSTGQARAQVMGCGRHSTGEAPRPSAACCARAAWGACGRCPARWACPVESF